MYILEWSCKKVEMREDRHAEIKTHQEFYQEVGYYLLSRNWAGLKWLPVIKVWEQLKVKHSEEMQNSYR